MTPFSSRVQPMWVKRIVFVAMVVFPLTCAHFARGQGVAPNINVDSLIAALDTIKVGISHAPRYEGKVLGNVSNVQMQRVQEQHPSGAKEYGDVRCEYRR